MPEFTTNIEVQIQLERIKQLYKLSRVAVMSLAGAGTIYALLLIPRVSSLLTLGIWYVSAMLILLARWFHLQRYKSQSVKQSSSAFWLTTYRLGILATGIIFGCINIFFFPHESLPYLVMNLFFPFVIVIGALSILLDSPSFIIYTLTLIGPLIFQMTAVHDHAYASTSILLLLLVIFCIKVNIEYNKNFIASLRLHYEKKDLLQQLEKEKNKLNNRLGRILNDSSNEIYVVNANSFLCLQVNRGAVENLGYNSEELTSISILEIFTHLDHESLTELIAPLTAGKKEFVIYQGENMRKDGSLYPVEARIQLATEDTPPIIIITVQNISERAHWEEKLIYQANFDLLTGLPNRHYIQSVITTAFTRARRKKEKLAVLFLDLDNFKTINDSLGHRVGDEVLKLTADRIRHVLRKSDVPARTGGDEFTVLLEGLQTSSSAGMIAEKLVNAFREPFHVNNHELYSTLSVGISIFPDDGKSLEQLMKYADMAMYKAKESGRNKFCFFSKNMSRDAEEQLVIISHLRNALVKKELSLYFQPKIDIRKGAMVGAEALLRWHNKELGSVSPDRFIHLAESMGFIDSIGSWVIENACKEAMYWQQQLGKELPVSVNVSPQQFRTGSLVNTVDKALAESGLPGNLLELEITESLLLQDSDKPYDILKNLFDRGITLSLDDFGTGYSSLSYLKRFPLQILKIDRSFIHDLQQDKHSRALVEAIIAMAISMKLGIVAEGIENEEQISFLGQRNVSVMQGFFFSPPMSAEQFRDLLQGKIDRPWDKLPAQRIIA